MPTYKHPCPYCDKLIDRTVAACPFCGVPEPFSPKRCQVCRRIIEDPAWVVCPGCGTSLTMIVTNADGSVTVPDAAKPAPAGTATPAAAPAASPVPAPVPLPVIPAAPAGKCAGCGAPLPAGARFCTVCGTTAA